MNRDHWKQMLPIITHFAEGGEVQSEDLNGKWEPLENPRFDQDPSTYRKKPTPRLVLRTSDDPELVWLKHGDLIEQIIAYISKDDVKTCSWRANIKTLHIDGILCSATRNGPWLPLVKKEIV